MEHEGVFPWQAREEITQTTGRRFKDSWFYGRGEDGIDAQKSDSRPAALAELQTLRKIERAAWQCQEMGRSEAAWNPEVHGPLLELGLACYGSRVSRELVTTAAVAGAFVPPMDGYSAAEYVERKMVDFALVLDSVSDMRQEWDGEEEDGPALPPEEIARDQRLELRRDGHARHQARKGSLQSAPQVHRSTGLHEHPRRCPVQLDQQISRYSPSQRCHERHRRGRGRECAPHRPEA